MPTVFHGTWLLDLSLSTLCILPWIGSTCRVETVLILKTCAGPVYSKLEANNYGIFALSKGERRHTLLKASEFHVISLVNPKPMLDMETP